MKKDYLSPVTGLVPLRTGRVLCASPSASSGATTETYEEFETLDGAIH